MCGRKLFWIIRVFLPAVFLSGMALQVWGRAPDLVALPESIRNIDTAPVNGLTEPDMPYVTRRDLKAEELGAIMEFEVALKLRNLSDLQAQMAHGRHISTQEMSLPRRIT